MNKIANQFTSIEQVADQYLNPSKSNKTQPEQGASFAEVLKEKQKAADVSEVKFRSMQACGCLPGISVFQTSRVNAWKRVWRWLRRKESKNP